MHKTFPALLFLCVIALTIVTASAGGPVFWRVNTRAEIEKGDARGVSIADNGALTLAPAFNEVFDTKQAYIWSAAADTAGNIYLGTGHEGRVFKVDAAGKGTLLYKTGELDVMALAVDAQGNLRFGSESTPVTFDRLRSELAVRAATNADVKLDISADKAAPIGQYVKINDVARETKIKSAHLRVKEAGK